MLLKQFALFCRLTPAYAFIIFYYCTMLYHSGDGPLWKDIVGSEVDDCRKNWWTNLLYLSTYVDSGHMVTNLNIESLKKIKNKIIC